MRRALRSVVLGSCCALVVGCLPDVERLRADRVAAARTFCDASPVVLVCVAEQLAGIEATLGLVEADPWRLFDLARCLLLAREPRDSVALFGCMIAPRP